MADVERDNARTNVGTAKTMENGIIGGEFVKQANPAFLIQRNELFDKYLEQYTNNIKAKPHDKITITLPDGATKEGLSYETTPLDIAKLISKSFANSVITSKVDDHLWDLTRPLERDCKLFFYKFTDPEGKEVFWHSSAHVLGQCMENIFGVKLCTGPALEDGFYYDSYMGKEAVSEKDYEEIEKVYTTLLHSNQHFQRIEVKREEAMEVLSDNPFKMQILNTKVKEGEMTTLYRCGTLIDLCLGPHVPALSYIKCFKIIKHSSCYWLGNASNDSLQRVYGVTFPDNKQLKEYLKLLEEMKKYDHRKIGEEQSLFFFHELSPGSCFFLPHGAKIYNTLMNFIREQYRVRGYTEVVTPNVFNFKLWEISGHAKHYRDCMFLFTAEEVEFGLKPMNCPGHCLMFGHNVRSYRDLPIRYADFGVLHRNEFSGALTGLTRVRRFQQDDAHIYCRPDQIKQEILAALDFMKYVYTTFKLTYKLELSTKPAKAMGDDKLWESAEKQLEEALNEFIGEGNWKINPGDGAFYGPKIDIKVMDAMGRQHQTATVQLDFQLPINFELKFKSGITSSEDYQRPVMIHRAMLGSVERCFAILCEHFKGKWPFWLSPRQAVIVPVSQQNIPYAETIYKQLYSEGFEVELDDSTNTLNYKIRNGQTSQFNYILVVGQKEEQDNMVNVRTRDNVVEGTKTIDEIKALFHQLIKEHL